MAQNPEIGSFLVSYLNPLNARKLEIEIQGDAVLDGQHSLVLILEAASPEQVAEFMQPFRQAGTVEIASASSCEVVVERAGC